MDEINVTNEQVNLELVLVTTSMNHEYAKKELEKTSSFHKRQELLTRMAHLKELYFNARATLAAREPQKLEELERELRLEKQSVFSEHLN